MVYLNEWLPNPAGSDIAGEWVELFNNSQSAVSLNGWSLKTGSGKKVLLKNYGIDAGGYLVLQRTKTKLALRNSNESLFLYDNAGRLVDESGFLGGAPEGKSFSRISAPAPEGLSTTNAAAGNHNLMWRFSEPSPGRPNNPSFIQNYPTNNAYPFNRPLNGSFSYLDMATLAIGCAVLLSVFIIFLLKRNEYLSDVFFGRD